MMKLEEMVVGERYHITMHDCCITGELTGAFVGYDLDEDGDPHVARFDIGTIGPMWGQWRVEPVVVGPAPGEPVSVETAIALIVEDIGDRRGLRQEWEQIDEEVIRDEILPAWRTILSRIGPAYQAYRQR